MPLINITIPSATIPYGKEGKIIVRGISLSDLMTIVNIYGPQATLAFGKIRKSGSLAEKDVRTLISSLATEFPDMVAAALALAADSFDDETIDTLKKLSINTQIEVIEAVFRMTFPNEGELKKLMESLTGMMAEASGALTSMRLPSSTGTGASAEVPVSA